MQDQDDKRPSKAFYLFLVFLLFLMCGLAALIIVAAINNFIN
jgi:hypothetical protein